MAKQKKLSFTQTLLRLKKAGLENATGIKPDKDEIDKIEDLGERIKKMLLLIKSFSKKADKMIFFVMYDIQNNKIRTNIAKYLIRNGCVRIQKSVYLAELERKKFKEIHKTLKEVQEVYNNNDSIMFVPVSSDSLTSMKIVGEKISFDIITDNKNTLFF